jgi:DNA topoisomerase-1
MSKLVIVESPAKSKTIARILGRGYKIVASMGHIRDLPKSKEGVDVEKGFIPSFVTPRDKAKIVKHLKEAAKDADAIYIATDPDREGEAIGWHLKEILHREDLPFYRILLREITPSGVKRSIEEKGTINEALVEAQLTRRILDRLMGYRLSPFLWKKVKRGLSAGRVQSVALKIVYDRELEREAFTTQEYWTITADLQAAEGAFKATLTQYQGKKVSIPDGAAAEDIRKRLESGTFTISKVDKKEVSAHPAPPFTTARLQQEANRFYRLSVKRTMQVAQKLYEGMDLGEHGRVGLITYMRTDSVRVASSAVEAARETILNQFGADYLPEKSQFYKNKSSAQDAHEAIRPSRMDLPPDLIKKHLADDEFRLYSLIYKKFLASQMASARHAVTTIHVARGDDLLKATGRILIFPGYLAAYKPVEEDKEASLPPVKEGETPALLGLNLKQNFTEPSPRFTEATLVKVLEEKGIGRPSTYATIIATLQNRAYCQKDGQCFVPTALGRTVAQMLLGQFSDIINENYTAWLEDKLDAIEEAKESRGRLLEEFYEKFQKDLKKAEASVERVRGIPTGENCPRCGKPLLTKWGKNGEFIACSGYPDCTYTQAIVEEGIDPCEKCGKPMVLKRGKFGFFYACSGFPECKTIRKTKRRFTSEDTGVHCPNEGCEGHLVSRIGKRKVFYGCSAYPKCTHVQWDRPVNEACPSCAHPYVNIKARKKICPKCGHAEKIEPQA